MGAAKAGGPGARGGAALLDRLAAKYGTDKGTKPVGALSPKGYTRYYAGYLERYRDRPATLLEIGVGRGGSLRMWEEYLPQARIVAIDVREACRQHQTARTQVFIGSQTDSELLHRVVTAAGGTLDVVIDDGGHRMEQHRASLDTLFPFVTPGGLYAIEDLHTAYSRHYGGGLRAPASTVEYLKTLVDSVNGQATTTLGAAVEAVHFYRSLAVLLKRAAP
jgi:spermidine synthase